ncbi:hypothetical protein NX722_02030 [Endozoicomonas gorgoniicola]|uniref:Uncharacterized protein n=1 Tax=Endozoicomonas gorgoniicola TaxID=1234144 RepID=A0ABT3MPY4_9GAMM|nr:hypothetical protein [Endozoicomonas gorgoniicola]MCW7551439.1 hypothetical protein [Endozoicomonas gorgoniicola]
MPVASQFTQKMAFDFQVTIMRSLPSFLRLPFISLILFCRLSQKFFYALASGVLFYVVTLPFSPDVKAASVPKNTDKDHLFYSFCKITDCFIFLKKQTGSDILLPLQVSDGYLDQPGIWRMPFIPRSELQENYDFPLNSGDNSNLKGIEMNYAPETKRLNMIYMGSNQTYGFISYKVREGRAAMKGRITWELPEKPISLSSKGTFSVVASTDKIWLIKRKKMKQMPLPGNNENPLTIKKVIMNKNHDIYLIGNRAGRYNSRLPVVYRYQYDSKHSKYKAGYEFFTNLSRIGSSKTYVDFTIVGDTFYAISEGYTKNYMKAVFVQGYDTETKQGPRSLSIAAYGGYRSLSVVNDRLFLITDGFSYTTKGKGMFKVIEVVNNNIKDWRAIDGGSENNDFTARVTDANEDNLTVLIPKTSNRPCKKVTEQGYNFSGCIFLDKYTLTH